MARELSNGQLAAIIRSTSNKLVAVDFSNPNCGPCRATRPWWDSLPSKYPAIIFCTIQCDECPDDAQTHGNSATPTLVFFLNTKEVGRVRGADRSQITSILEKYKSATPTFSGHARSLTQPRAAAPPAADTYTRDMLLEMGFPARKVEMALGATRNGTVDECVLYLESLQAPAPPELAGARSAEQGLGALERMQEPPAAEQRAEGPKSGDDEELRRRREVQEQNELRAQLAQAKGENDAKLARAQKAQERQGVPQQGNPGRQAEPRLPPARAESLPPAKTAEGPCTLQLVIDEDKSSFIGRFQAADTLQVVYDYIVRTVPGAANKHIAFETVVPRQQLESPQFRETLADLQLTPRARVIVKYL
jgi:thiol-disulfide isomerase/thioredoxin